MLLPKRVKHRKVQRGHMKGSAKGGTQVNFGDYGLKAMEGSWITNRQIEAARVAMTRYMKRGGKVWINISGLARHPEACRTRRVLVKVQPEKWVAVVKPGRVMFRSGRVSEEVAKEPWPCGPEAPDQCKFVTRANRR